MSSKPWLLSRRMVLRGASGVALSVPLLEAMFPNDRAAAQDRSTPRLFVKQFPHGFPSPNRQSRSLPWCNTRTERTTCAGGVNRFHSAFPDGYVKYAVDHFFEQAAPNVRAKSFVVGKTQKHYFKGTNGGNHTGEWNGLLYGGPVLERGERGMRQLQHGETFDQRIAREYGLDSLSGAMEFGRDDYHPRQTHLSYREDGSRVDAHFQPSTMFTQVVGREISRDPTEARARLERDGWVMDQVLEQTRRLQSRVGQGDRDRLDRFYTAVHEIEQDFATRREALADQGPADRCEAGFPEPGRHGDAPYDRSINFFRKYNDFMRVFKLAMQCDTHRVFTFSAGGTGTGLRVPEELREDGSETSWHAVSHWQRQGAGGTELPAGRAIANYNTYRRMGLRQLELFLELAEELDGMVQGNGRTILEDSLMLITSEMIEGQTHFADYVPVFFAGGAGGQVEAQGLAGRRFHCDGVRAPQPRLANVWLSIIRLFGIDQDSYSTSNGFVF